MMLKFSLAALILACGAFCCISSASTPNSEKSVKANDKPDPIEKFKDLNFSAIMNECNETFKIDMEFLKSLNDSGSFPDETLKAPKCFVRCYLEKSGVMDEEGSTREDVAVLLFAGERGGQPMNDLPRLVHGCAENRNEACLCERTYSFTRCLMEMEIELYE